jgi:cytochrome b subunit of formate dehydrogenase
VRGRSALSARSESGTRRAGALPSTAPIISTLVFIIIVLLAITGMVMTTAPGFSSAAARHEEMASYLLALRRPVRICLVTSPPCQ